MANYKNLERIHEIAESLPQMEQARTLLAWEENMILVATPDIRLTTEQLSAVVKLPNEVKYNVLNVLNLEINKQKEELKEL